MAITARDARIKIRTVDGWLDPLTGVTTPIVWPTEDNVGINAIAGWEPTAMVSDDNYRITTPGTVIEDMHLINGSFLVFAPNVTLRRCLITNGGITNYDAPVINNGMLVEDCTVVIDPPGSEIGIHTVINMAGFTANRCAFLDVHEGIQTGGTAGPLADPDNPDGYKVRIYNSYFRGQSPGTGTDPCPEFHGDLMQPVDFGGTGGTEFVVRNTVMWTVERNPYCGFSSCMDAYPGHCQPVDIDGLVLSGAAFSYRGNAGGSIKNLYINNNAWNFWPVTISEASWPLVTEWDCVVFNGLDVDGQPTEPVGRIPYGYLYGPPDPL